MVGMASFAFFCQSLLQFLIMAVSDFIYVDGTFFCDTA